MIGCRSVPGTGQHTVPHIIGLSKSTVRARPPERGHRLPRLPAQLPGTCGVPGARRRQLPGSCAGHCASTKSYWVCASSGAYTSIMSSIAKPDVRSSLIQSPWPRGNVRPNSCCIRRVVANCRGELSRPTDRPCPGPRRPRRHVSGAAPQLQHVGAGQVGGQHRHLRLPQMGYICEDLGRVRAVARSVLAFSAMECAGNGAGPGREALRRTAVRHARPVDLESKGASFAGGCP